MPSAWDAEIELSDALAGRLIEAQFSELRPVHLRCIGEGWDNRVFRVNERFVFRFPRREIAVPLLANELKILPLIELQLPLAIPVPRFVGEATMEFPYLFLGYDYFAGTVAARAELGIDDRAAAVKPLAGFLRALHGLDVALAARVELTGDTIGRLNHRKRLEVTEERIAALRLAGAIDGRIDWLAELRTAPEYVASANVIAHGDVHAEQLLVDEGRRLSAVIDWGDVHVGDAASDLAVAHAFFPRSLHDDFLRQYGDVNAARWQAARTRAIWHSIAGAAGALDRGDDEGLTETLTALRFLAGASH